MSSNDERIYVAPLEVYTRHEHSGLVQYGREEVLVARDDLLAAEDEYRAVELEVGLFLEEQEEAVCGPHYAYRAIAFEKYAPDHLRPLMNWPSPSSDSGGSANNMYPVKKWQGMARTFRSRAAKLRKLLGVARAANLDPAATASQDKGNAAG